MTLQIRVSVNLCHQDCINSNINNNKPNSRAVNLLQILCVVKGPLWPILMTTPYPLLVFWLLMLPWLMMWGLKMCWGLQSLISSKRMLKLRQLIRIFAPNKVVFPTLVLCNKIGHSRLSQKVILYGL